MVIKVPIKFKNNHPTIPVVIKNPKNGKTILLDLVIDTGASNIEVNDSKNIRTLGLNTTDGHKFKNGLFIRMTGLLYQIGGTRFFPSTVTDFKAIDSGIAGTYDIFGLYNMQQFKRFIISKSYVIVDDSPKVTTTAAFAQSFTGARYRNRI